VAASLQVRVRRLPGNVEIGRVFDQSPRPATNREGNLVVIKVSSGKPKVSVPTVVGNRRPMRRRRSPGS
jgi:beta-lactam-binding protein with PASTA domain